MENTRGHVRRRAASHAARTGRGLWAREEAPLTPALSPCGRGGLGKQGEREFSRRDRRGSGMENKRGMSDVVPRLTRPELVGGLGRREEAPHLSLPCQFWFSLVNLLSFLCHPERSEGSAVRRLPRRRAPRLCQQTRFFASLRMTTGIRMTAGPGSLSPCERGWG